MLQRQTSSEKSSTDALDSSAARSGVGKRTHTETGTSDDVATTGAPRGVGDSAAASRMEDWSATSLLGAMGLEERTGAASEPRAVQRKAETSSRADGAQTQQIANAGLSGAAGTLPHQEKIQQAFGAHDVGGIQAHVGGPAAEASRAIGASAYATGNSVAFREAPDLHTAAHEAAHVVQQRQGVQLPGGVGTAGDPHEQMADAVADRVVAGRSAEALLGPASAESGGATARAVQRTSDLDQFGQAASGVTRNLICDLTSPIRIGSQPFYRMAQHGDELWSANPRHTYQWTVRRRSNNAVVSQQVTATPEVRIPATAAGQFRIEAMVLSNGAASAATVSLDQDVIAEDAALTAGLATADPRVAATMRELVNDFRQYIIDGAQATGPNGITPRVLASVLYIEVLNRPKPGREQEVNDVGAILTALERGEWVIAPEARMNHSMGVGQIRPATAAMVTGDTPMVDQDRTDRDPARAQIQQNYEALPLETKRAIFTQLQWPKSNIRMAAQLLASLKNRAHRFPTLTRAQFAANRNAVGVVATEYNSGGTDTPAAQAAPADYGLWVWGQMTEPLIEAFFPNA